MNAPLNPSSILQTAFGFWGSKVLLTAVEMGVFTTLGARRLTGSELTKELRLHMRANPDFFDALVAMKFLDREGDGPEATYFNTPEGAMFLDAAALAISAVSWSCSTHGCSNFGMICRKPYGPADHRMRSATGRRGCSRSSTPTKSGWSNSWVP